MNNILDNILYLTGSISRHIRNSKNKEQKRGKYSLKTGPGSCMKRYQNFVKTYFKKNIKYL